MNLHDASKLLSALLISSLAACASAGPNQLDKSTESAATETEAETPAATCKPKSGTDPEALSLCTGSKGTTGRCVPLSFLHENKDTFETADCSASAACVPDELVRTGGAVDLRTCQTFGREGRCFWPLAKRIAASYDILKSESGSQCDPDMVCAPCVNPLDGKATGVCEVSAKTADCTE